VTVTASRAGADGAAIAVLIGAGALFLSAHQHRSTPFDAAFEREAMDWRLDPNMLRAIAKTENDALDPIAIGRPNKNGTRDYGLMQINEITGAHFGETKASLLDPEVSIKTAAVYLDSLRAELGTMFNDFAWVGSYNAGAPAVKKHGIVNPDYVAKVFFHWQMYALGILFK